MSYAVVDAAVRAAGLVPRGGFHPEPADAVPALAGGRAVATLVLVGNVGPTMWEAFARSPERSAGGRDPLDRWSRRVVGALAARLGAEPLFPFGGPPWHPFVAWAIRAEPVHPSPIGLLVHPEYGLWHAYRGALAFAERIADLPPRRDDPRPCDACEARPCLRACPVDAFSERDGYDVARCVAHLDGPAGHECLAAGCLARCACPVGMAYRSGPAQAAFHMRAFLDANRGG